MSPNLPDFYADRPTPTQDRSWDEGAVSFDQIPDFYADSPWTRPERTEDVIRRARNGRPYVLVLQEDGSYAEKMYTRVTTYIDCLDDKTNLQHWQERRLLEGFAMLVKQTGGDITLDVLLAMAHDDQPENKDALNELAKRCKQMAGSTHAANRGTAYHTLTERFDLGMELPSHLSDQDTAALNAYVDATKYFKNVLIEQFMVNDDLKTGGTPDRVVRYRPCPSCGGRYYIADLKTGNIHYGPGKIGMQLALYANSRLYNRHTGERTDLPEPMCRCTGIIYHLAPGTGRCDIEWVNIKQGWAQMPLASKVREHRNLHNWTSPFTPGPDLLGLIEDAGSEVELADLWTQYKHAWSGPNGARLTAAADARRAAGFLPVA